MASTLDRFFENCATCGCETPHSVSIRLREESNERSHDKYSKEPYRVTVCDRCDRTERLRMNDQ